MPLFDPLSLALGDILNTALPDLILAFTFFTAVIYAVLSRRFGQQRPAVAMSAALGMALSIGLVWWEYVNGYSIRNLGPIAVGFAVILLAGVMYQAIRGTGGNWAGAGIALGASLLIGWGLGLNWHIDRGVVQSLITVLLTAGVIAFLLHRHGVGRLSFPAGPELADIRHDMGDLYQDQRVAHKLNRDLRHLKREARHLAKHPDEDRREASDIMLQLRRILPAEGWLTQRMAGLREKVELARQGQIHRILEKEQQFSNLSPQARKKAGEAIAASYQELRLDGRLERLDKAVAANELRIRNLTQQAQQDLAAGNYPRLANVLEEASKLQRHNAHLFKLINQTEARLVQAAAKAAQQPKGVKKK